MIFWIVAIALGLVIGSFALSLLNESPGCGCAVVVGLGVVALFYAAC